MRSHILNPFCTNHLCFNHVCVYISIQKKQQKQRKHKCVKQQYFKEGMKGLETPRKEHFIQRENRKTDAWTPF